MNAAQLYFAIGVPVFAIIIGIVAGILQMNVMGGRFTSMEGRLTSLEASMSNRFTSLETSVNSRLSGMEARFETLIGKVVEIDNRLTRVEAILERH